MGWGKLGVRLGIGLIAISLTISACDVSVGSAAGGVETTADIPQDTAVPTMTATRTLRPSATPTNTWVPVSQPTRDPEIPYAPQIGSYAPDFSLEATNGEIVYLSDFLGRPVMLNFWATWCKSCVAEMPAIQSVHEIFGENLAVISIDVGEITSVARSFMYSNMMTIIALADPNSNVAREYRALGLPTTYFIDENGLVRMVIIGSMTETQILDYLSEMGVNP